MCKFAKFYSRRKEYQIVLETQFFETFSKLPEKWQKVISNRMVDIFLTKEKRESDLLAKLIENAEKSTLLETSFSFYRVYR